MTSSVNFLGISVDFEFRSVPWKSITFMIGIGKQTIFYFAARQNENCTQKERFVISIVFKNTVIITASLTIVGVTWHHLQSKIDNIESHSVTRSCYCLQNQCKNGSILSNFQVQFLKFRFWTYDLITCICINLSHEDI